MAKSVDQTALSFHPKRYARLREMATMWVQVTDLQMRP